jgi:hypothetical protein
MREYPKGLLENIKYRVALVQRCQNDIKLQQDFLRICKHDILFWVNCFCQTKDPRRKPADTLPFITYDDYQEQYILDVQKAIDNQEDLLTDKSRDMGVSWMILYVFTHKWLFESGSDFRVGSRKEDFVDKLGDIDTLLEKVRFNLKHLPIWMLPPGFNFDIHAGYMRIINPENGNCILGESANEHFGSGGRRKALLLDEFAKWEDKVAEAAWTACYSKDTEALTINGWKLIKNIKVNDFVYSMNIRTRKASFELVLKTYEQEREDLISLHGKAIDLLVTKNHKIVYETNNGNVYFKDAQSVMNMVSGHIPLVSRNSVSYKPETIYGFTSGDWMEFLGWYIAEGCTSKGGTIIITQSQLANPAKVEKIKNLLFHLGLKYSYNGIKDFNVNVRRMNKNARQELKSLGKCHEKYIPRKYFSMHKSLLFRLYQGLMSGDGCDRARSGKVNATSYTTVSYNLASDVQALAQLIGYKASIRSRLVDKNKLIMGRKIKSDVRMRYDVFIGYKTKANIDKLDKSYVRYNDKVYCVETKFHTLYVRRNGIACWCGNTADVSKCRLPVSTPVGSANKFAQLANGTKERIKRISLHWTLHPEKGKDAYYIDNGVKIPISSHLEAFKLWQSGVKVRSPWYDAEAERRSEADLAQEVDIDYLKSGHPFFSMSALQQQKIWDYMLRRSPGDPIPYGKHIRVNLVELDNKIQLRESIDGWLRVFELPSEGKQYVVSADTAEGLAKGDESFLVVRDKWTRNVVACGNGHWPTDDFSVKINKAGRFYNGANEVPENNNHGHSVCKDLEKMDSNLYYTKHVNPENSKETIVKAGFSTTNQSRPLMLDQLEEEVRKVAVELRDEVIIAQCRTFVFNAKNGKPEADGSFLDDGVIATAIGSAVIKELPYKQKPSENLKAKQKEAVREMSKPIGAFK